MLRMAGSAGRVRPPMAKGRNGPAAFGDTRAAAMGALAGEANLWSHATIDARRACLAALRVEPLRGPRWAFDFRGGFFTRDFLGNSLGNSAR